MRDAMFLKEFYGAWQALFSRRLFSKNRKRKILFGLNDRVTESCEVQWSGCLMRESCVDSETTNQ